MPRMTLNAAENLTPAQATALVRVLDLQAKWQNLKDNGEDYSTNRLQRLQRTFETYRVALAEYTRKYGADDVLELSPTSPKRLGAWCLVVQVVMKRATYRAPAGCPVQLVTRAYWLADQIAGQLGREPVAQTPGLDTRDGVLAGLKAVGMWCSGLASLPDDNDNGKSPSHVTPAVASKDDSCAL